MLPMGQRTQPCKLSGESAENAAGNKTDLRVRLSTKPECQPLQHDVQRQSATDAVNFMVFFFSVLHHELGSEHPSPASRLLSFRNLLIRASELCESVQTLVSL